MADCGNLTKSQSGNRPLSDHSCSAVSKKSRVLNFADAHPRGSYSPTAFSHPFMVCLFSPLLLQLARTLGKLARLLA